MAQNRTIPTDLRYNSGVQASAMKSAQKHSEVRRDSCP
jgi:hypothetical protein